MFYKEVYMPLLDNKTNMAGDAILDCKKRYITQHPDIFCPVFSFDVFYKYMDKINRNSIKYFAKIKINECHLLQEYTDGVYKIVGGFIDSIDEYC